MVRENNSFFIFFLIKNTNLFNIALSEVLILSLHNLPVVANNIRREFFLNF